MKVTVDVTSTTCTTFGYCGWFSFAVERHSSLPCIEDDAFLINVGSLRESSGTAHEEWTYELFFPRTDKICVFISNGAGVQRRAQYYLELYPDDPSGLDGDNDGAACEANDCPCGAEPIPPEPAPPAPALPVVRTSANICAEGHHRLELAWLRVGEARRRFQRSRGTRSARRKHQALVRRIKEARQTEQQQIELCGSP